MRLNLKRALAGAVGLAAVASLVPLLASPAAALPPAGASDKGSVDVRTAGGAAAFAGGNSDATFTLRLNPASPGSCNGDNSEGFGVRSFIVSQSVNLNTLTFNSTGPTPLAYGSTTNTRSPLFSTAGSAYTALPATAASPGGPGPIINIPDMNFSPLAPGNIPAGIYKVGIACVNGGAIQEYWDTLITVTANSTTGGSAGFTWVPGANPAPTLDSVTPSVSGPGTCMASFTPNGSIPAATSFTATATGTGGGSQSGTASPITISGLTPFTTYAITVTATNPNGTSGPSNSVNCTPTVTRNNVTGVQAVVATAQGPDSAVISWTNPAANSPAATPVSYTVLTTGVSPLVYSNTQTINHPANSTAPLTGLAVGSYSVSVTANYADNPTTGSPAAGTTFTVTPDGVLFQAIDVTRPVGALVLTQVCNSHAAFASTSVAEPGFPTGLPAVGAANPSIVGAPAANTAGSAPTLTEDGARPANEDPLRPQYPYPTLANGDSTANYPTWCGLDLGPARFVTTGTGAGQFFAATGVLNEVTVVDTRDDAPNGWTITGQAADFVSETDANDRFSARQLGWNPVVASKTNPFPDGNLGTYTPNPVPGGVVDPNSTTANTSALEAARTLASTTSTGHLGTTVLDARLRLLIPVTADAGVYESTFTITTA